MPNVLVACEESQAVTIAMRELGIKAWSCDLLPASGGHPEWHYQWNVTNLLAKTKWDMVLAFPPCTHLSVSGAQYWKRKQETGEQQAAVAFFLSFVGCAPMVAIENPIGIMSTLYRKPDQIIHPWQFGHGEQKSTCLWLQGLPKLVPTDIVEGREQRILGMSPSPDRAILRSKTYPGIARAMANQWGTLLLGK